MGNDRYTRRVVERQGRPSARDRLLDAAADLFYAHGIAATGVDAVLQRAGASPTTLYAHFGGKDDLVAAYLERRHERWRQAWDETLARAEEPIDRMLSVFDALALHRRREGAARGCAVLAAAAEVVDPDHPARTWIERDTTLLTERLGGIAKEIGAERPDELAATILLVYDGVLASYARIAAHAGDGNRDPLAQGRNLAEQVVRLHLHPSG
jgi:AcrR family transcriptional regulator